MQRWEYLAILVSGETWATGEGVGGKLEWVEYPGLPRNELVRTPEVLLNAYGKDGWELVGVAGGEDVHSYRLFLKRLAGQS